MEKIDCCSCIIFYFEICLCYDDDDENVCDENGVNVKSGDVAFVGENVHFFCSNQMNDVSANLNVKMLMRKTKMMSLKKIAVVF
jgi:hypothetical protein